MCGLKGPIRLLTAEATFPFGGSVPMSKLLEEDEKMPGVLLATQMNGQPLLADHGFPMRNRAGIHRSSQRQVAQEDCRQ
jgi:DMSO/TMAO reductase YedYZ molybdopterin-dependent catalytic subunit